MLQTIKKLITLFCLSLVALSFTACGGKSAKEVSADELLVSLDKWEGLKATWGNGYSYETGGGSWVGSFWRFTRTIEDGQVIRVETLSGFIGEDSEVTVIEGDEIDEKTEPTIDDLYKQCRDEILVLDAENHTITLDFDDMGILSRCQATYKRCEDDCTKGVKIDKLLPRVRIID